MTGLLHKNYRRFFQFWKITCFLSWLILYYLAGYSQINSKPVPSDSFFIPEEVITQKKRSQLTPYLNILADSSGSLDIHDIIKPEYQSRFVPNYTLETGTNPDITYWGHIILQGNNLSFQEYRMLLPVYFDEVKLYEKSEDGTFRLIAHGGFKVSPFTRIKSYPNYFQFMAREYDDIKIKFNAGERKEWFIKAKPSSRFDYAASLRYFIPDSPMKRNPIFLNIRSFKSMEHNRVNFFFSTIYSCIFLIMGFYHLILFGIIRERLYGYFALILFSGIFYIYKFFVLYHFIPVHWVLVLVAPIIFCLLYASFIQFSRYFLRTHEIPILDRLMNYALYFLLIYTIFLLLREVAITFFDIYSDDVPDFDWRFSIDKLITLYLLVIAIWRYRTGYRMSLLYIIGLGLFTFFVNFDLIFDLIDTYILGRKDFVKIYLYSISSRMPGLGLCLMLFILAIALSIRYNLNQKEKNLALQQNLNLQVQINEELQAKNQLEELDKIKTRFFTNITHEFRTPLTVIMGMTSQIKGHIQQTQLIKRNSQRLLQLINQLLDLSKIEAGQLSLNLVQQDIIPFLAYLTESFQSLAEGKRIRLTFYPEVSELIMDYDPEKLQQVVTNLLSNAIKYTPEGGKVILHTKVHKSLNKPSLSLKITDTGQGISAENLPHIFDRFYQVDDSATRQTEGTGIGLALSKELVAVMGGKMEVESTLGEGSIFTLLLPITQKAELTEVFLPTDNEWQEAINEPTEHTPLHENAPVALIIEDNQDVVTYLQSCLQAEYQVVMAYDGESGINKALEIVPDIIISDVMMPKKDGYEVCQTLKEDLRTSHIPIIMLTAKATQEDKIKGLDKGADAYLMKPFDPVELEIRLQKLLEIRNQIKNRYQSKKLPPSPVFQQEDAFLQKLRMVVEKNMDDENFGVEALAHKMKLSRVQVHRKLKALTDQTTTHFIREIRMKRAVELLQTTDLQIAEVAYQVGYGDPSYFTRQFVQVYGMRPSEVTDFLDE